MKQRVVGLVFLALSACGDPEGEIASTADEGAASKEVVETAIPVRAEPVVREDLFTYLETYARLEPVRQVTVYARTTGLVERLCYWRKATESSSGRRWSRLRRMRPASS
jgi:multidrug efflux pump subunit AcrA (membrane-fusion protein)